MTWHRTSTAPKPGQQVYIWWKRKAQISNLVAPALYRKGKFCGIKPPHKPFAVQPTYWRPIEDCLEIRPPAWARKLLLEQIAQADANK